MLRYLTIPKFALESGYTEDAIRSKIRDGIWPQDEIWHKAPDGRILIDVKGYEIWVERGGVLKRPRGVVYKSRLRTAASVAVNELGLSPPPLI